jgi:hypothetical protein
VVNYLLFQPAPSVATALLACIVMPWSGYAVLHLAGYGRHRWPAALFAGPAITLALWIIALSGAAWASIPLKEVLIPVWIATLFLAIIGGALAKTTLTQSQSAPQQRSVVLWLLAAVLPFAVMPSTLHYGLGIFASSVCLDGWSYVAVAEYLSHVPRGVDSGLSALHQYGSHLMYVRNASSAILAQLAMTFSVRADEVASLYCIVILFANACALIAFASTLFKRVESSVAYLLIAGVGIPAFIISYANFDQLLLLPILPLTAVIAFRAARGGFLGPSFVLGILIAAAIFAYIEMAFLGLLVAAAFVVRPDAMIRASIIRAIVIFGIAIPIAMVLTWPGLSSLLIMFKGQYVSASQSGSRPGEGMLANWLLRGEFLRIWWIAVPIFAALILAAITACGVLFERRRWGAVIGFLVVASLVLYFMFYEKYLYAVYKIVSINFWMFCFFTIIGGERLLIWAGYRVPIRLGKTSAAAALLLFSATTVGASVVLDSRQSGTALLQHSYREALTMAGMVGQSPVLLSVLDDLANQWAVLYLSDAPLLIFPYRSTMSQAHVVPVMNRAKAIRPTDIRYIVTDRNEATRSQVAGAIRIWDGQTYSLWKIDDAGKVAVIVDRGQPTEQTFALSSGHASPSWPAIAGDSGQVGKPPKMN